MSKELLPESATLEDVVLELVLLRQRVEELEDLRDLNAAIERNADKPGIPWEQVCKEFGWGFAKEQN
ncbi:MAG: hypothetical protein O2960_15530 [Verrucomicrobia bacterium]|nr:hypothetical protein [Verrucomicrobiota bacterium]